MTGEAVVIGGGISGLAAAYYLAQGGMRVTVLDKAPVIGGHLRVSDVGGVPVDEGAESLLNRRPEAVDLASAVGLGEDVVYPASVGAGLWSRGSIAPLPRSTVMGVPSDPAELAGLLTPAEIARIDEDRDMPGMPLTSEVSVGRFVAERMGAAVVDRLVEPLLAGVYAGRADELSLRATVPQLATAAESSRSLLEAVRSISPPTVDHGRIAVSEHGKPLSAHDQRRGGGDRGWQGADDPAFAGIRGGVGRLPPAVAAASGADMRTGVTVRAIRRQDGGGFVIETGPAPWPELIEADVVVVAVPPTPAARLLADVAPVAARELGSVEQASVGIVTLAIPSSAFPDVPLSSGFLVPPVEGRTAKAVTLSSVKWPWLGDLAGDLVLLRASVGRHRHEAELQRSDDELVSVVMTELGDALGVNGTPVDSRVTRWGAALPQYAVGHAERMATVQAAVADVHGLAVCGAAYAGVGIAACVAGARQAASSVLPSESSLTIET